MTVSKVPWFAAPARTDLANQSGSDPLEVLDSGSVHAQLLHQRAVD